MSNRRWRIRAGDKFQFVRTGYFCRDANIPTHSTVVTLKDSYKF